jgi:hypothetical protein
MPHIHITRNLGEALSQLEQEGLGAIWVDGVCINQGDTEEKE